METIEEHVQWLERVSHELLLYDDINIILDRILFEARSLSHADAGTIYLVENDELVFAYTHNDTLFPVNESSKHSYSSARLPINDKSIAGYCAVTRIPLKIDNVHDLPEGVPYTFNDSFDKSNGYETSSLFCFPVMGRGRSLLGVIQLINSMQDGKPAPFTEDMAIRLFMLSMPITNAIERTKIAREMIMRMQKLAALSDPSETAPHVERVGSIAAELYHTLAEKTHENIDVIRFNKSQIRLAAMLHDLGKVAIPNEILKKPGKLTAEEFAIMQQHSARGAFLFETTTDTIDNMARAIAAHHHQKWNGNGYTGSSAIPILAGKNIPLEARIVAVADVFDALTSNRCYKAAWKWEDAVETLKKDAGSHFDPDVVEAFLSIENTIKGIYEKYQED